MENGTCSAPRCEGEGPRYGGRRRFHLVYEGVLFVERKPFRVLSIFNRYLKVTPQTHKTTFAQRQFYQISKRLGRSKVPLFNQTSHLYPRFSLDKGAPQINSELGPRREPVEFP